MFVCVYVCVCVWICVVSLWSFHNEDICMSKVSKQDEDILQSEIQSKNPEIKLGK